MLNLLCVVCDSEFCGNAHWGDDPIDLNDGGFWCVKVDDKTGQAYTFFNTWDSSPVWEVEEL